MQKIVTFLTFNGQAEEAVNFYTSIFKNSKIVKTNRYGDAGPLPKGTFMTATFELEGQTFIALNGGSGFSFSTGISLMVNCKDQAEVDALWDRLGEGGKPIACGWIQDKFGVSWQIVPTVLGEMISDKDTAKASRAMKAMMGMVKLDVAALKKAYEG